MPAGDGVDYAFRAATFDNKLGPKGSIPDCVRLGVAGISAPSVNAYRTP